MTSPTQMSLASDALHYVENDLLRGTEGSAIEWYGRAGTALYRAFSAARLRMGSRGESAEVILPSVSCATPANAALLAGVTARFAEVDSNTGMPSIETIQARWSPRTCAVVFIHLFGQTADLRELASWCRSKNILLIEDVAQALGAKMPDGSAAGSAGDLSVYSFNPTKILECGGGALLIRSRDLLPVFAELSATDPIPSVVDQERLKLLSLSYRNLHHSLVALSRSRAIADISGSFLTLQPAFRELYLRQMSDPAGLADAWSQLPAILRHRTELANIYDEVLADGPWTLMSRSSESGVCWRYSLLISVPEKLVEFSDAVRQDGFHVSNLYWPVNDFFRPDDRCPQAEAFGRRIVNLWVDSTIDERWARRCAESLLKNAERFLT